VIFVFRLIGHDFALKVSEGIVWANSLLASFFPSHMDLSRLFRSQIHTCEVMNQLNRRFTNAMLSAERFS
jgi:hypothetical protein